MREADRRREDWLGILGWFVLTRTVLTGIGVASRALLAPFLGDRYVWVYSPHTWMDVWAVWDSGWYFSVVRFGYESVSAAHPDALSLPHAGNYGFFPLYPALVAAVHTLVPSLLVSGLLVSNGAFLCASYLLLRLLERHMDRATAWRAVRYLHLFPATFVLSGAFSESLCLALMLACWLSAERGALRWAALAGFLLALTRPVGVFLVVPLAWAWWRGGAGRPRLDPRGLYLAALPLGLLAWMVVNQVQTGDALAFARVKAAFWGAGLHEPVSNALGWTRGGTLPVRLNAWLALAQLVPIGWLLWQRRVSWFLLAALFWAVPIAGGGAGQATGVLRFATLIFPYYALLAEAGRDPRVDRALTVGLALLQGFLMVTWANGLRFIV